MKIYIIGERDYNRAIDSQFKDYCEWWLVKAYATLEEAMLRFKEKRYDQPSEPLVDKTYEETFEHFIVEIDVQDGSDLSAISARSLRLSQDEWEYLWRNRIRF